MSGDTDTLRDIYLEVTGTETVTESQEEGPSRAPIDEAEAELEREVSAVAQADGLDGAIRGTGAEAD